MTSNTMQFQRSKASIWVQAARPFALSASVIPVLIGSFASFLFNPGTADWILFPTILIAAVLFHTGGNFISEYYDYKQQVDREDSLGSSRVLVEKLLMPKQILNAGILFFTVGFILGLILVYYRGLDILYLGLLGLIAGVFYTMKPFQFKYIALGDLLIFFAFGPLLVLGSYMGLTGDSNWNVIWISIPISFLVVAILHANNTRDMSSDTKANIKTQALLLGIKGSIFEYNFLLIGAYLATVFLIVFGLLDWYALIVLISLPTAIKNIKEFSNVKLNNPELIAMMDVKTAQLHMQFGLLFVIGMILSGLL